MTTTTTNISITQTDFNELCTSPSGILWENAFVLIGVRHEYEGAQGRCALYIGNVSQSPLNHVCAVLSPVDHLRIHTEATEGLLEQQGCTVGVGTQAKLLLLVQVLAPFDDAPAIRVLYETPDGITQEHVLKLPIVTTCFTTPLVLGLQSFKNQWHELEELECRDIIKHVPANEAYMESIADIVESLNFERCWPCDDTPWSVSGASVFSTAAKNVHGQPVSVQCLVRIEADHKHRAIR